MKRLLLALPCVALVLVAVAFSRPDRQELLTIKKEERNPWTNSEIGRAPGEFQFAIVSDRTGSHRAQVFSRAVARLNLLQPEFVMSVGDLIEGGKKTPDKLAAEWKEFDGYVNQLTMPFFYVPGNHDLGQIESNKVWSERYGRSYYHFVYRDVLFLCLNTDDPPGAGAGNLSEQQVNYALSTLADNKGVRWTLVFLHKPVWTASDVAKRGWLTVEKALAARPYTVFCGHVHRYRKFVRQGRNYYQLATTGGGSKLRGLSYGEFDHIAWVTMKKDGPVIANLLLDSVLPDDLKTPPSSEAGVDTSKRQKTTPVKGVVYYDGSPLQGALVTFSSQIKGTRGSANALTEGDGSFVPSMYVANDGLPVGKYQVTVVQNRPLFLPDGQFGPNRLPKKYADVKTSGLEVEIKEGENVVTLDLSR